MTHLTPDHARLLTICLFASYAVIAICLGGLFEAKRKRSWWHG